MNESQSDDDSFHIPAETLDWENFEEVSAQVIEELGDIRVYPIGEAQAQDRLQRALQTELHFLQEDDLRTLEEEMNKCLDVLSWEKKQLRLEEYTSLSDGRTYVSQLAPHLPGERVLKPLYPTPRHYGRTKRVEIRRDIARYYRYGTNMRRERKKLVFGVTGALYSLGKAFDLYGKNAQFCLEDIVVTYIDYKDLEILFYRLLREGKYIESSQKMQNPFSPPEPLNYLGQHARAIFSMQTRAWLKAEPKLEQLRRYIGEDFAMSYLARGMTTLSMMTSVVRSCIWGQVGQENDSKTYFYFTTNSMRSVLGFPETVRVLALTSVVRWLLLSSPATADERDFLAHEDDDPNEFPILLSLVQEYCDISHMGRKN